MEKDAPSLAPAKPAAIWWNMQPASFDRPTWAEHCVDEYPYESVMEIGNALGSEFPYFHAILKPERTFLQYLIAELICNVAIPDKHYLEAQVERLYTKYIDEFHQHFAQNGLLVDGKNHNYLKRVADQFFEYKKMNKPYRINDRSDAFFFYALENDLLNNSYTPNDVEATREIGKRLEESFQATYDAILESISKRNYLPGENDQKQLTDFKKVFIAAALNDWEQRTHQDKIKRFVEEKLQQELAHQEENGLKPLPVYSRSQRTNIVITGNIAAGKTAFLHRMQKEGKIDRNKSVMIDIDEFRELERIVNKSEQMDPSQKTWTFRAHDECHQIRRKILDILEEKTKANKCPNVVFMTALVSPRVRRWLTEGNPDTQVYMLYSDPDRALKGAYERSQHNHRWLYTQRVLSSLRYVGETLHYLFCVETDKGNNLSLEVLDTTNAKISLDEKGNPVMNGETVVVKANQHDKVQLYDINRFRNIYLARYINTDATSPDKETLYHAPSAETLNQRLKLLLRPHNITFHGKQKEQTAFKPQGSDQLEGDHLRSVLASSKTLAGIYGRGGREQGRGAGRG